MLWESFCGTALRQNACNTSEEEAQDSAASCGRTKLIFLMHDIEWLKPNALEQPWVENSSEENGPCPHLPILHLSSARVGRSMLVRKVLLRDEVSDKKHYNLPAM